jgi:hypothetical protein
LTHTDIEDLLSVYNGYPPSSALVNVLSQSRSAVVPLSIAVAGARVIYSMQSSTVYLN